MLCKSPPQQAYSPPQISVDGTNLNDMKHYIQQGSVICTDATVSKDLDNCLSKASSSFGRLSKRVWKSFAPPLHEDPSIQSYHHSHPLVWCRDLGSPSETDQATQVFHQCCLHSILAIKWQDCVSNEEVLKKASLPSTESILLQVQLHWAGQVKMMEDVRMPNAVFFGEL